MTRRSARGILPLLAAAPLLLTACSDNAPSATDEGATTPTSSAMDNTTDGEPPWTLLSNEPEGVPLAAGAYGLSPSQSSSQRVAVVQAPEGYQGFEGWTFVAGESHQPGQAGTPFHAMGYVTADRVYPNPCGSLRSKAETLADPGPTVADLTTALTAQKGATTSEPRPVTVDGHRGLYLDYQVSKGVDFRHCGAHAFDVFGTDAGGASWYLETSRERAAIWILDVDGERLVLSWVAFPGVPRGLMREMTDMAESARFVDAG
jgi:hypothetical protein